MNDIIAFCITLILFLTVLYLQDINAKLVPKIAYLRTLFLYIIENNMMIIAQ